MVWSLWDYVVLFCEGFVRNFVVYWVVWLFFEMVVSVLFVLFEGVCEFIVYLFLSFFVVFNV